MEKIKLVNGKTYEIVTNGVSMSDNLLTLKLSQGMFSLADIDTDFSNSNNTSKILLLSDSNEVLKTYNNFLKNMSCEIKKKTIIGYDDNSDPILGTMFIVTMQRESDIEARINKLEITQEDQDLAIEELAQIAQTV